ncbi:Dynein regulatory complex protein 11 [Allomyces arbusculus]|nr:Dynein regulatory complex protein 11 [Allomyces arbusculus]
MSNLTYIEEWQEISAEIAQQLQYENPTDPALIPKDREAALLHLTVLYAKYIRILQRIEIAHDQTVHPQKIRLLRSLLMSIIGRLIEVKLQIYEVDASDFPDLDAVLLDLKLLPEDLDVPIPKIFAEERAPVAAKRETLLDRKCAKRYQPSSGVAFPEMTIEEAVLTLQRNERGRQGRIRAKYMRDIRLQEEQDADLDGANDVSNMVSSVIKIQKIWRAFKGRRLAQLEAKREAEFLGMATVPSFKERAGMSENMRRRKDIQKQHEEEFQQALVSVKDKIRKVEGPDIKESYQDAFRQWYMDFKREAGKFPDFPPDEQWKLPGFAFGQAPPEDLNAPPPETPPAGKGGKGDKGAAAAGKKDAGKDAKKDGKKDAGKKGGGKGKEAEEEPEPILFNSNSNYLRKVQESNTNYLQEWKEKNEADNFAQRHDIDIIKNVKRREVDAEMKDELFGVLKEELENLKLAMEKDSKKKKKDGGKKKKKDKKAGGKKGKKEKDLTGGRPIEELIDELAAAGLMQIPERVRLDEFKGRPQLTAKEKLSPEPSLHEIKRVVTEYCILPLGLDELDDTLMTPRSILLYGPPGCGKSMLVDIVATETGAVLFNLSPKLTAGQYTGKSNVARMVYTVFKVAKALAPAVVVIDDAEAVFAKKVPKEDTSDPKRIRKDLVKAINALKPSDRVLVMGISRNPFYSDAKAMSDAFHRQIYVPRPNYGSRETMWREWIAERAVFEASPAGAATAAGTPYSITSPFASSAVELLETVRRVNTSVLARISAGYSPAAIKAVVYRTLTPRRIHQLPALPLQTEEIVQHLFKLPEPDRKVEQDFRDWTLKLPLFKKREIVMGLVPEEPQDKGGKGKGGKDAKKKK